MKRRAERALQNGALRHNVARSSVDSTRATVSAMWVVAAAPLRQPYSPTPASQDLLAFDLQFRTVQASAASHGGQGHQRVAASAPARGRTAHNSKAGGGSS